MNYTYKLEHFITIKEKQKNHKKEIKHDKLNKGTQVINSA